MKIGTSMVPTECCCSVIAKTRLPNRLKRVASPDCTDVEDLSCVDDNHKITIEATSVDVRSNQHHR